MADKTMIDSIENPDIIDFNKRQISLMLESIVSYEENRISFGTLIGRLETLLNEVKLADADWKDQIHSLWLEMEIIYALILDDGGSICDYSIQIDYNIKEIKLLLKAGPDDFIRAC